VNAGHHDRGPTAVDGAVIWLHAYLTPHGRTPSSQVKEEASKAWHSESTLKKAAKELKVVVEREGFPSVTYWSLPGPGPDERPEPGRCPEQVGQEGLLLRVSQDSQFQSGHSQSKTQMLSN
jgi:hypothetical protein